jgi:hypothetical protein
MSCRCSGADFAVVQLLKKLSADNAIMPSAKDKIPWLRRCQRPRLGTIERAPADGMRALSLSPRLGPKLRGARSFVTNKSQRRQKRCFGMNTIGRAAASE